LSLSPRPEIEGLGVCPHGGIDRAELEALGISPEAVLDFSVCVNPYELPSIRRALSEAAINQYPDIGATELRRRLSEKLGVAPESILVGSGTTELIRLIALAYFRAQDPVLILEPTYGDYEVACQIAGARVVKQWTGVEDDFAPKLEETVDLIKKHHPRAVFICNPNNPTGGYLSRREMDRILAAGEDTLFVLDEAYISFVDCSWPSLELVSRGNVIVLRSMTKDYALAGLRLGYAVASPGVIRNLRKVCPPWNVNVIAQRAGLVALEDAGYLKRSQRKIREAKRFLISELSQLGLRPLSSETHYFLVKVGDAGQFRAGLLKKGILVRDCTSFGLPEYVRIAPRTMPECHRLITAIRELKESGELGDI